MKKRKGHRSVVPILAALGLAGVAAIVAFAQSSRRPGVEPARVTAQAPDIVQVSPTAAPVPHPKPLSYYMASVRADLFTASDVEAPKPKPAAPKPTQPAAPEIVDPFVDYAYDGTVQVGGQMMALIENVKTKEGQYLRPGDPFLGGTVDAITERSVSIKVGSRVQTLNKTDNFTLTPLDKSAPYLTQTAQPTPQMPMQPAAMAPPTAPEQGPSFPGMDQLPPRVQERIRQRWQNMTPEERQRAQTRWLNRQFDRGQRRGFQGFGFGG
ncbi:MAG: hypothetical protein ACP5VE_01250 [Chthonomonadales bacterium]